MGCSVKKIAKAIILLLALTVVGLVGFLTFGAPSRSQTLDPPANAITFSDAAVRVHFINVGKGDATLLEFPCAAMLVDVGGGPESQASLLAYLDAFFERRPDLNQEFAVLALTHGHMDHTRHIGMVLERYTVRKLFMNGHFKKRGHAGLREALKNSPQTMLHVVKTKHIPKGGLTNAEIDPIDCGNVDPDIRLLWGSTRPQPDHWKRKHFKDENNHSVSLLVRVGAARILLTGDLQFPGLKDLRRQQGHILKDISLYQVSHHGFRNGTSKGFLEHLNPRVAVLSRSANHAWYAPTLDRFNAVVRDRRAAPKAVPIWLNKSDKQAQLSEDPNLTSHDLPKETTNTKTGTLDSAIYWTGIDGHIIVGLNQAGDIAVETAN